MARRYLFFCVTLAPALSCASALAITLSPSLRPLVTSNRPVEDWGKLLGDAAAVTAMLDRLLHHAETVLIQGRSYRMKDKSEE